MARTYDSRVDVYRNGSRVTTLRFLQNSPPEITADADAAIKTGLRGVFLPNDTADMLNDELRPVQIIDGVEHPCGVFHAASYQEQITEAGRMMSIEAYDKCFILQETTVETTLFVASTTEYTTIIAQMLTDAGIKNYIIEPSSATLMSAREWETGTDYLTIVNELLAEINYDSIWFDDRGYGILKPHSDPAADNIAHTYQGTDVSSVLSYNATESVDIFGKPNVFICICENPDLPAPLVATSVNDSAVSSLSTIRRGRRIAQVFKIDNIASQTALQEYADRIRFESMMSAETLAITTASMPGHGIGDTVAVVHHEFGGIYRETGWKLTLGVGQLMQHNLQRKVIV